MRPETNITETGTRAEIYFVDDKVKINNPRFIDIELKNIKKM